MTCMSKFPTTKSDRTPVASQRTDGAAGNSGKTYDQIRGLGPMTRVTTAFGEIYAHTLRERDRVKTKSGEYLRIVKIDRITFDEEYLHYHPGAQPILLRANALANGVPGVDIVLAPHQQFEKCQMFNTERTGKAVDALHKPNVSRKIESQITYTMIYCEKPASVCCEGVWVKAAV